MGNERFYTDLTTRVMRVSELMADESRFAPVPADWEVILTDVRGSTRAFREGRHQTVNLVATGSIIAALNIGHRAGITLPFFFGGDGATLLAPRALAGDIENSLAAHRDQTLRNFALDLRVGRLPIADIHNRGHDLRLAKVDVNGRGLVIPVALGEGLQDAERVIKSDDYAGLPSPPDASVDLEGMECRWDSIRPPETTREVVCLLVTVRDATRQASILSVVLSEIDRTYGTLEERSPISLPRLHLKPTLAKIATEMRAKLGRFDLKYLLSQWVTTRIGPLYFALSKDGTRYLERLVQLSDTLMIDGRVNTVISGTPVQRALLQEALERMERAGDIGFGLQVCQASVISCYVRDRRDAHIHFVDGLDGGYTRAATMLKKKMATAFAAGAGAQGGVTPG